MKKNIFLSLSILALGACVMPVAETTGNGGVPATSLKTKAAATAAAANEKLQLCMIEEATNMLVDGTFFNQNMKTVSKTIANTCAQKLAIQSLPEEYQTMAQIAIQAAKAAKANKQ